ncbi:cyd operon YbgE family protein [Lysobacter sp. CCNWLW3]|uniref:cyd operon YbgE family protein n=1 Tax=unclassified Lysobacter TaxID=2635362 RepID=UPI002FD328ED
MARVVSLLMASGLSLALLFLPAMRGGEMTPAGHGLLSPLMLAICAGFVHAVGYRPLRPWLRVALHPVLLWPAMLGLALAWARCF